MRGKAQLGADQRGFAAITVTLVIMALLVLISVSFVTLIGREQRQAIDRQLSAQAFYAAEAGVNDAVKAVQEGFTDRKSDCGPLTGNTYLDNNEVGAGSEYSCLLIDPAPKELEYSGVSTTKPTVMTIKGRDDDGTTPVTIDQVRISWEGENLGPTTGFMSTYPNFPPAPSWTSPTGVLRASLTPVSGAFSRNSVMQDTFTAFLYPQSSPAPGEGNVNYVRNMANQGEIVDGHCHADNKLPNGSLRRYCSVVIDNVNSEELVLSLRSIYATSTVSIMACRATCSTANQLRIAGAQTLVDSTGKVGDVLRRIAVRVPIKEGVYPGFAIESVEDICKRYLTLPRSAISAAGITNETLRGGGLLAGGCAAY